jgi:hypothetical protein
VPCSRSNAGRNYCDRNIYHTPSRSIERFAHRQRGCLCRLLTNFSSDMYVSKMSLLLAESDTVALLEKFDLAGRTAQHRPFDGSGNSGVVTTIDCSNDIENGIHIEVTISKHVAKRQLPLSEYEAETLVDEFVTERLLPGEPALQAMVAHVFLRFSRLFSENEAISHLRCEECHIHRSDYRIDNVQIWVDSPLHVKPRLTAHAHDRKAMFGTRSGSEK